MTKIDTRAAAQQAERDEKAALHARLRRLQLKALDAVEEITDSVLAEYTQPAIPITVERRFAANTLRMHAWCPRAKCRRAHACLGEPLDCLRSTWMLVPLPELERFVTPGKRSKRR